MFLSNIPHKAQQLALSYTSHIRVHIHFGIYARWSDRRSSNCLFPDVFILKIKHVQTFQRLCGENAISVLSVRIVNIHSCTHTHTRTAGISVEGYILHVSRECPLPTDSFNFGEVNKSISMHHALSEEQFHSIGANNCCSLLKATFLMQLVTTTTHSA